MLEWGMRAAKGEVVINSATVLPKGGYKLILTWPKDNGPSQTEDTPREHRRD